MVAITCYQLYVYLLWVIIITFMNPLQLSVSFSVGQQVIKMWFMGSWRWLCWADKISYYEFHASMWVTFEMRLVAVVMTFETNDRLMRCKFIYSIKNWVRLCQNCFFFSKEKITDWAKFGKIKILVWLEIYKFYETLTYFRCKISIKIYYVRQLKNLRWAA